MKIKILSLIMVLVVALGMFTGCGLEKNAGLSTASVSAGQSAASDNGASGQKKAVQGDASAGEQPSDTVRYPLTLKDANGTEVSIAAKPTKIVCLPLGACEMLLSLVDKSRIAAMTNYVDDPAVSNVADTVKGVGKRLDFNAERIIAIQPDLVLADTWQDKNILKQLRDSGISVFVVNSPKNVDEQKEMLKLLGQVTDSTANAEEVTAWMEQKLKAVSDKLAGLKEEQKLSIIDYSEMGSTSGKDTNFDDVVTRAGLTNPVAQAGLTGWPQLSKEMIIKYNPDIISVPSWFYDTSKTTPEGLKKSISQDKSLAGVKAVKNNRLILIPYNHLSTTSQYSVLAVEDMAKAAYPELFK